MIRRLALVLFVLALAAEAKAQETYSIGATAAQVTDLTLIVTAENGRTCEKVSLLEDCTQAAICTLAQVAGGASCTAAAARNANVRIFPATQAGREEFVMFRLIAPRFTDLKAAIVGRDRDKMCTFWAGANRSQKDAVCTAVGRPSGCEVCQ